MITHVVKYVDPDGSELEFAVTGDAGDAIQIAELCAEETRTGHWFCQYRSFEADMGIVYARDLDVFYAVQVR
jgi:hypothetical protein